MNIWNSMSGMLTVEITSAEPESLFDSLACSEITVSSICKKTDLVYQVRIFRRDYQQVSQIVRKRADSLTVIQRQGIYWFLKDLRMRPLLISLFLFLLILTLYLPTRVLFIEVTGNQTVPSMQILDAAAECGIHFGANRNRVRSEKLKNELLAILPQLQWAGINTYGCRAVISVTERAGTENKQETNYVTNIIADQDAYILSATVTTGTGMVKPGDSVTKGQILISGYTDCDFYIQASRATGEILAQTNRSLTVMTPEAYDKVSSITDTKYRISLLIGKKRINLWKDSRISDAGCGRMYEEYFFSLPGGFRLPAAICIDRYFSYELQKAVWQKTNALQALQKFSDDYLNLQMTAGQILHKMQNTVQIEGAYLLKSDYVCSEIIGKECREQIGDINGKRN